MRKFLAPLALILASVAGAFGFLVRRYVVQGESMLRAYAPGDRLLIDRVSFRFREPRIGEVVVVRQPRAAGRRDLKRIAASPGAPVVVNGASVLLAPDEWFVLGDNLDASTDSRQLGPVKRRDILGRAWFKY